MQRLSLIAAKRAIAARLDAAGVEAPLREAAYILAAVLGIDRAALLALDEIMLTGAQAGRLETIVAGRAQRIPLARLLGQKEFWGLPFGLNEATLVPRPETETLIEAVLQARPRKDAPLRILDLGTGTGCILLSLLHEYRTATGLGIDSAAQAVMQARANAASLKLSARTHFQTGDWCQGIAETFDIVVSNPPYIGLGEKAGLMPEVSLHDPAAALFGGMDGLAAYRAMLPQALALLRPGGLLALEIGAGQAEAVNKLVNTLAPELFTLLHADLAGIERVVTASRS